MAKINFSAIAKTFGRGLKERSPEILVGIGIVGMIGAAIMAVKATPKALEQIKETERETKESLTPKDTFKVTWRNYVPSVVTGTLSAACIIGANSIHLRRKAALSAACALSETALANFKSHAIERIGEKKVKEIADDVAKEQIDKNPVSDKEIIFTSKGNTLCYDPWCGRYFRGDIDYIRKAEYYLNQEMQSMGYTSLNNFYYLIGLDETRVGETLGWNIANGRVELDLSSQLAKNDEPCVVLGFYRDPHYDFEGR